MLVLMFVLFIAANNLLTAWLQLFVYSAPVTEQPSGAAAATSAVINPLAGVMGTGAAAATAAAQATAPVAQSFYSQFLSALGVK